MVTRNLSFRTRTSPEWGELRAILAERLLEHCKALESHHNEVQTAALRGRITELRQLLALETNPPPVKLGDPTHERRIADVD